MMKVLIVLAMVGLLAGCEMPSKEDNTTISSEGDVVIINNSDGTTEVVTKPTELVAEE